MSRDVEILPLGAERLVAVHASPVDAVPLLVPFDALRLGPEEWLCVDTTAAAVAASVGPQALVLDVGDAFDGWRITGVDAPGLLARACALDAAALTPGVATRTVMGGVTVVLRVVPGGFELRVDRSYAAWFAQWLERI